MGMALLLLLLPPLPFPAWAAGLAQSGRGADTCYSSEWSGGCGDCHSSYAGRDGYGSEGGGSVLLGLGPTLAGASQLPSGDKRPREGSPGSSSTALKHNTHTHVHTPRGEEPALVVSEGQKWKQAHLQTGICISERPARSPLPRAPPYPASRPFPARKAGPARGVSCS